MQKPTVLVIEDAAATRRLVELSLTLEGFEVLQRADGISGLEAALQFRPNVVVLDVALPGIDGWEVLRRMRADLQAQTIPVVMITAHDTPQTRKQAEFDQADAFVGKPFDINYLREVVTTLARDGV